MLRHIVIDYEDRELGDLIRSCAKRVEGCAQICVGLLNLDGEVGRQSSRAVLAALSRDVGHPGSAGHDDRRAVAVRRRVIEVLRIDDGELAIILIRRRGGWKARSEEHTSELQSLMRISYAVFCLKKKKYIIVYKHN